MSMSLRQSQMIVHGQDPHQCDEGEGDEEVQEPVDPDLMEFNNGLLAGLSREDADRLYPPVENLPIDQALYGQESKVEFRRRAENALQRVLSENGSGSIIAIVTHGGMVNQLYSALLHMPIGEDCFFCTADTGIHIWEITDHGSYVRKANIDDHIKGM